MIPDVGFFHQEFSVEGAVKSLKPPTYIIYNIDLYIIYIIYTKHIHISYTYTLTSMKSCPFCIDPGSSVASDVFNSTDRDLGLYLIWSFKYSTTGDMILSHWVRRGVNRLGGHRIFLYSVLPSWDWDDEKRWKWNPVSNQ